MSRPSADDSVEEKSVPRQLGESNPGHAMVRAQVRRRTRIRGWVTGAVLGFCCGGLGYSLASLQALDNDKRALIGLS